MYVTTKTDSISHEIQYITTKMDNTSHEIQYITTKMGEISCELKNSLSEEYKTILDDLPDYIQIWRDRIEYCIQTLLNNSFESYTYQKFDFFWFRWCMKVFWFEIKVKVGIYSDFIDLTNKYEILLGNSPIRKYIVSMFVYSIFDSFDTGRIFSVNDKSVINSIKTRLPIDENINSLRLSYSNCPQINRFCCICNTEIKGFYPLNRHWLIGFHGKKGLDIFGVYYKNRYNDYFYIQICEICVRYECISEDSYKVKLTGYGEGLLKSNIEKLHDSACQMIESISD